MARLEAARKTTPGLRPSPEAPPPLPATAPTEPPPLPAPPAHRLLTRLSEAKPKAAPARVATEDLDALQSIDVAPAPPPAPPRRRWWRDGLWAVGILAAILGGAYGAYRYAIDQPAAPSALEPELAAKRERARAARKALEQGHDALQAGRLKAAVGAYEAALGHESGLASAERGLGIAFTRLKQPARAVKHYQRYLELAPEADDAREVRGLVKKLRKKL